MSEGAVWSIVVLLLIASVAFGLWGCPQYMVYSSRMTGQAALAESEAAKQVMVEEAKAALEAARYLNEAEVARAEGVARANAIIGESLKGNEEYLRYLWIQNLEAGQGEKIYIPTEAGLPILEARPKGGS